MPVCFNLQQQKLLHQQRAQWTCSYVARLSNGVFVSVLLWPVQDVITEEGKVKKK